MSITQAMATSFRAELMLGAHDFRPSGGSVFKLALYTAAAQLDANTTTYTSSNEVPSAGTNYAAGGNSLTNLGVTATNVNAFAGVGFVDFSDLTFNNLTTVARGALIYNSTPRTNSNANTALTNPAVAVLDFGSDRASTDGTFTIIFPTADSTSAIIRIA
ncbi:MAG: hypothetical protein DDT25_00110 [Chloroflexi bacterium]|nr:hypothetical protein [Chloroflexota bacterium]